MDLDNALLWEYGPHVTGQTDDFNILALSQMTECLLESFSFIRITESLNVDSMFTKMYYGDHSLSLKEINLSIL